MHSALWIGIEIIIKLYGRLFADIKNSNFLNLGSGPFQVGSRWRRCNRFLLGSFLYKGAYSVDSGDGDECQGIAGYL